MGDTQSDRFVRVPTDLLDMLFLARLSGAELRIILWVIRQTFGWNRSSIPFSWYKIASELRLARPAVYRAGKKLLALRVLLLQDGGLAIETDHDRWKTAAPAHIGPRQRLRLVAKEQRQPLPDGNVAGKQRKRCPEATLFRRAKDRCKDRKTAVAGDRLVDDQKDQRRICGDIGPDSAAKQVMDHYIALQDKALTQNQAASFYQRFRRSAQSLLDSCGNVQSAKEALTILVREVEG